MKGIESLDECMRLRYESQKRSIASLEKDILEIEKNLGKFDEIKHLLKDFFEDKIDRDDNSDD